MSEIGYFRNKFPAWRTFDLEQKKSDSFCGSRFSNPTSEPLSPVRHPIHQPGKGFFDGFNKKNA